MPEGEIFLGYSTGWKPEPRRIALNRHALTVAGSGAGKGTCQIMPNLRGPHAWQGSAVVVDPKGEAARETAAWRSDELGQEVAVLDPFGYATVPDELRRSLNPLDMVETFEDVVALGNGLILRADNERDPHWNDNAQALLQGVVALVKSSPNVHDGQRNLATVARFLDELKNPTPIKRHESRLILPGVSPGASIPEGATVASMAKAALRSCTAFGGLGRKAAALVTETKESESFFTTLNRQTLWLASERMQAFLAAPSSVDLRQLKRGRMTVYLVLPPDYLADYARFLRVFTQQALSVMWEKMPDGSELGTRCLFLLDEFPALGRMDKLKVEALPLGRSFGLHVWPFLQYWQQLVDTYGESGAEAFLASCDAFSAFGLDDVKTPQLISDLVGRVHVNELPSLPLATATPRRASKAPAPYMPSSWHDEQKAAQLRAQTERKRQEHEERERRAVDAHRAAMQNAEGRASAERSIIMARAGIPRLPADEVTRRVAYDPQLKHARTMLVRLTGNNWIWLKPHPYYRPEPEPVTVTATLKQSAALLVVTVVLALLLTGVLYGLLYLTGNPPAKGWAAAFPELAVIVWLGVFGLIVLVSALNWVWRHSSD